MNCFICYYDNEVKIAPLLTKFGFQLIHDIIKNKAVTEHPFTSVTAHP